MKNTWCTLDGKMILKGITRYNRKILSFHMPDSSTAHRPSVHKSRNPQLTFARFITIKPRYFTKSENIKNSSLSLCPLSCLIHQNISKFFFSRKASKTKTSSMFFPVTILNYKYQHHNLSCKN